ncbi:hypothetical protein Tco_0515437 [Tanacetum coccineum]
MTLAASTSTDKSIKDFDELISTPIDFSGYILNGLKIKNLTQEIVLGPTFRLFNDTCSNYAELEYDFEECYKALSEKLDWENPEGGDYLFDLSKPLPLITRGKRQRVPFEYFINNDLKYLQGGVSTMTYTTYKAVRHRYSNPMIQLELEGSTQGYPLVSVEVLRFNTTAGNPVKKILLKLNLSDHRLFKDGGGAIVLTKKIFGNMKRGFRGVPKPLLPAMLPVVDVDQSAGQADQAVDQPSPSEPLPSSSHPLVLSATTKSKPTPVAEQITHPTSLTPELDSETVEHTFEQPSPKHQPLLPT